MKEEGILGLYKGVTPPLIGMGLINMVMFSTFNLAKETIGQLKHKNAQHLSIPEIMAAGAVTGWIVSFVVCPVEQIKARLQVQYAQPKGVPQLYKGPIDCARQLIRNNGILGLYKGFAATIMTRNSCYAYFSGYVIAERYFKSKKQNPNELLTVTEKFISGGVAGTCYWLTCYPLGL